MNIAEIARIAGVGKSSVSRALNSSGYVAPETKEKIMQVVRLLGYQQNKNARNLRNKSSDLIGIVIPDISNEYYSMLVKVLETEFRQAGYIALLCNTEQKEEIENLYITSLLSYQAAAIVLISSAAKVSPVLKKADIPIILLDRFIDKESQQLFSCIASDNIQGGKIAVRHLFNNGAKKILIIGSNLYLSNVDVRINAAIKQAQEFGMTVYERYIQISAASGYEQVLSFINEHHPFDSIFCCSDTIAIGALRALEEKKLKVPQHVQIVGFDNIALSAFTNPPLTTVAQDVQTMGKVIKDSILQRIQQKNSIEQINLPVKLIQRLSTK